jgi:hypothetical protein
VRAGVQVHMHEDASRDTIVGTMYQDAASMEVLSW